MSDEMKPELLVLLDGRIDAERLVVTWPKVHFDYGDYIAGKNPSDLQADDPFTIAWGRIAGLDREDVAALAPMLFENGILRDSGDIDPVARAYLQARGVAILQSPEAKVAKR